MLCVWVFSAQSGKSPYKYHAPACMPSPAPVFVPSASTQVIQLPLPHPLPLLHSLFHSHYSTPSFMSLLHSLENDIYNLNLSVSVIEKREVTKNPDGRMHTLDIVPLPPPLGFIFTLAPTAVQRSANSVLREDAAKSSKWVDLHCSRRMCHIPFLLLSYGN